VTRTPGGYGGQGGAPMATGEIERRDGFAGVTRTPGGYGGHVGAPM
jgi:hypothetical protein